MTIFVDSNVLTTPEATRELMSVERLGMRFSSRETESDYQVWRTETAIPFTRIGIIASCVGWLGALAAIGIGWPHVLITASAWVLLVMYPAFAATIALTYWQRLHSWVMPATALANTGAGFLLVGVCAWLIKSPNMIAGSTVIVAYFGFTIFRLPPLLAAGAVASYVSLAQYILTRLYQGGYYDLSEFVGFSFIQWIAYGTGLLVCVALERVTREAYRNEKIIEHQQQALVEERAQLSKFLSPEVTRMVRERGIDATLVQQTLPITAVCCDLRGFTRFTEMQGAQQMAQVLREYYEIAVDVARRYDGTVKDFAGDGVLVLVGAPLARTDHAQAGLGMARDLIRAVRALTERISTNEAPLGVGVGIATGLCAVGAIGSQNRLEYTAVGSPVNLAARLCDHSSDAEILIAPETAQQVNRSFTWREETMQLKGFAEPISVFVENLLEDAANTIASAAGESLSSVIIQREAPMEDPAAEGRR